jgi:hypothetical protein
LIFLKNGKKKKKKKNYDCITYILQFLPSKRVEAKCGKQIQENQENTQVIKETAKVDKLMGTVNKKVFIFI